MFCNWSSKSAIISWGGWEGTGCTPVSSPIPGAARSIPDERTVSTDLGIQIQRYLSSRFMPLLHRQEHSRCNNGFTKKATKNKLGGSMRGSPRPMGSIRDQIEFNSVRMRVYLSPTVLRSCSSFFSSIWSTQHAANETRRYLVELAGDFRLKIADPPRIYLAKRVVISQVDFEST